MCGVGQRVANIHVTEGVGGELEVEGRVFAGILVGNGIGQRGGVVGVGHMDTEGVGNAAAVAVAGNEIDVHRTDIGIVRRAAEGAGDRVEAEPGGQGAATGQLCGVGQGGAGIHVVEGVGSELEAEGRFLGGILIGDRIGHGGGIVGVGHDDVEGIGNAGAVAVVGDDLDAQRADVGVARRAAEGTGGGIETEPGGQGAATGQLRGIGQGTGIHVVEGVGGKLEIEGRILAGILVGNRIGQRRQVIDRGDRYARSDTGRCRTVAATAVGDFGNGHHTVGAAWVVASVAIGDAVDQRAHLRIVAGHAE